jgi:hypothetical protein
MHDGKHSMKSNRSSVKTRSARLVELDPERIASAALAVVDKNGVAGFTMNAVSDALGRHSCGAIP